MKIATLLVIFLAFSMISLDICSALTRSHRYRRTRRARRAQTHTRLANNRWAHFFGNAIMAALGKGETEITTINKCLPESWTIQEADPKPTDNDKKPESPKTIWTEILDGISKVIGFFCKFKDNIKNLFARKIRRQMRRRSHRLFIQSSLKRYRRTAGWWSSVVSWCKSAVRTVVETAKGVVDWAATKWSEVQSAASSIISNLSLLWDTFKDRIKNLFPAGFVEKVTNWYNCIQTSREIFTAGKELVMNIISRVKTLITIFSGNLVALAGLLIDLLCNFDTFREAFNTLADGLQIKDNVFLRYAKLGKFAGLILKGIVTRRIRL